MPAARQRSRSPFIACAVMATIGRRVVAALAAADRGGRRVAVHLRHLAVHEDQRVGAHGEHRERLAAVAGDLDGVAALGEHRLDHALVDGVVLDDQDACPSAA